jgi:hypothetical protein
MEQDFTEEEFHALIDEFENLGFLTFEIGADEAIYFRFLDYIRENLIPTYTNVDRAEGTVTITKRPPGSLEFH